MVYVQKKRLKNLQQKTKGNEVDKVYLKIDKNQIVYDEKQIDYINDHQSRIYISFVDINPFQKFGIRAHYDQMTFAHCLHSMFISVGHKDILPIWLHFLSGLFCTW